MDLFKQAQSQYDWVLHTKPFIPSIVPLTSTLRYDLHNTMHPKLGLPSAETAAAK